MEEDISKEEGNNNFRTPPDNTVRKKYHNYEKGILQRYQHATTRSVPVNAVGSSPLSRGIITLRRINLSKLYSNQNCLLASPTDYEPVFSHISKTNVTYLETPDNCNKEQIGCENVTSILINKSSVTIEQLNQAENDRVPTFLQCVENSKSLCADKLGLNKLCNQQGNTYAQKQNSMKDTVYDNCHNSSINPRQTDNMKTFINPLPLKAAAPKQLSDHTLTISNLPLTVGTNCDNFIEASNLSNEDVSDECNNDVRKLSGNALEFKLPITIVQSWLIQKHSTPLPFEKTKSERSFACGRVSLSSFDDNSFSPVQITLPPESPQEVPALVTYLAINTCNKATISEPEIQNVNVLSGDYLHNKANEKACIESPPMEKREETSVITTLNHNQESCINEMKVKDAKASVTKSRNVKDSSLKTAGTNGTLVQRVTRATVQRQKRKSLGQEPSRENADNMCHIVRSEKRSKPNMSIKSRHKSAVRNIEFDQTKNYSENSILESDAVINVQRSNMVKARSARLNNVYIEKAKSLETEKSETLTNKNGCELKRKKNEHFKKQELTDHVKNNNIASDKAEIAKKTQKIRKEDKKVILTVNSNKMSAPVNKCEVSVTKINQSGKKPGKKLPVTVDMVVHNPFDSMSKTINNSEMIKQSDVNNAAQQKIIARASSRNTDRPKQFPLKTELSTEKEERYKTLPTHCQSLKKSEQCYSLGAEYLKGKSSSKRPRSILAKFQQPRNNSSSVLGLEKNKNESVQPDFQKHQDCSDLTISCEDKHLAELESHIHLQSSISEVHSHGIKPSRKKTVNAQTQKSTKSKKNKLPECDGSPNSVSNKSFKKPSLPEVHNFRFVNMSQRQLRKRKTEPVVATEDLPNEESKVSTMAIMSAKVKEKRKGQTKVDAANNQEGQNHIHDKKQRSKKESFSELTLDNKIIKRQEGETKDVSARKKKVQVHKKTSEPKIKEESANEDISSTITQASQKFVGAHCSISGGVSNAVKEAVSIGARAFGLFVRNGRTWKLNPLDIAEAEKFKQACKEHGFLPHLILPHGSYLLNCGSSNPDTLQKSRDTLIHELTICEMLGLQLYNFHPGSACGKGSLNECLMTVAESINLAHQKTHTVKTVIENMSCQGSTVGGKFEELKVILDNVKDKSRIGFCLDTCHAFAAGFDLSSEDGFNKCIEDFDRIVGLQYLCAMHLNDSKGKLGCHLDRHENIGKGHIGLEGFRSVMNHPRLNNIPLILETPVNDYAKEIKILYGLQNLTI